MHKYLEPVSGSLYRVVVDIKVNVGPFAMVEIPEGTLTNLGTIPKQLHWLIKPDDEDMFYAFLVHDVLVGEFREPFKVHISNYLYDEERVMYAAVSSWDQANEIMRTVARMCGAPAWKRQLCYLAIKVYGYVRKV